MIDEIYDRQYQAARKDMNAGLDRLFGAIAREFGKSMTALHRIEWSAPWESKSRDIGRA